MRGRVLLDTGPLVALLSRRDRFHQWATIQWGTIRPPALTCEPVLTETMFLIAGNIAASEALLEMLNRKVLETPFRATDHPAALGRLMRKYSDIPMSFADACLVRMSELYPDSTLLTFDGDFRVYRRQGRQSIPLLMPLSDIHRRS